MRIRTIFTDLSGKAQHFIAYGHRLASRVWGWVRRDPLATTIVGSLLVILLITLGGLAISSVGSLTHSKPGVVEEVGDREIWTSDPTLFPDAEQMLESSLEISAAWSRFDPYPQVRTAQELADDALNLVGMPVIIVGRIGAIESRDTANPELGGQEIALLGNDGLSRVVLVAGVSIGRFPPPLIPERSGRLVPLPGSPQRFKPDLKYGVFLAMIVAVGTTTSPTGGPIRTAYVLAADGSLMNHKHVDPKLGVAVQQALNDLPVDRRG